MSGKVGGEVRVGAGQRVANKMGGQVREWVGVSRWARRWLGVSFIEQVGRSKSGWGS